jgi:S-adenosylmethionine hydrolase
MEAMAFERSEGKAYVMHLMHGIPEFNITAAARTMEGVRFIMTGIHVCVCDPGVGTSRRAIAIETGSGHIFVGPDNGVFIPACNLLGGISRVHELTNDEFHRTPVSPIFHGRDIFAPVAGHIAAGVEFEDLGPSIDPESLVPGTYDEAKREKNKFYAKVIQINRFGSLHLNILHEAWDEMGAELGQKVQLKFANRALVARYSRTFGEVEKGEIVILRDDYGRVEIALNLESFKDKFGSQIDDLVEVTV